MLSLLKIASAFSFVRRSCSSRSLLIGRPMRNVRSPRERPRPPGTLEHRSLGRDQLAALAELEQLLVGADDADVSVSRPMAAHASDAPRADARGVSAGSASGPAGRSADIVVQRRTISPTRRRSSPRSALNIRSINLGTRVVEGGGAGCYPTGRRDTSGRSSSGVEQRFRKPSVVGSNPTFGSTNHA